MSLITQIQTLATRIATEFNTLRGEKVTFAKVDDTLKGSVTNNTGAWNLAAAGEIICALSANTNIVMSNYLRNKVVCVTLTLSSGALPTWEAAKTQVVGDAIDADGVYYLQLKCVDATTDAEKVIVYVLKSTF